MRTLPFLVGRSGACDLLLASGRVSSRHAEIQRDESGGLRLRDLGSTNGTFVNGTRVEAEEGVAVREGDIVHFADEQFRLVVARTEPSTDSTGDSAGPTQVVSRDDIPAGVFQRMRRLQDLLDEESALFACFQPIVSLADPTSRLGVEVLGRGNLDGETVAPGELFGVASHSGREADLSAGFRRAALRASARLPESLHLFLNTHPAEVSSPAALLNDLEGWREVEPDRPASLEIHEGAVADVGDFAQLSREVRDLGVGIAFDDFGRGQARLLEIVEVEPDWVKFDRAWIENLHEASAPRRMMMKRMVRIVEDLGIATIAEGVELEEEAAACRDLGFEWAQGYLFGRPAPEV